MSLGETSLLNGPSQYFGVNPVCFSSMSSNSKTSHSRRIDEQDFVTPLRQHGMHVPSLSTCLDGHSGRKTLGTEHFLQAAQRAHRSTGEHLACLNLTKRYLLDRQI